MTRNYINELMELCLNLAELADALCERGDGQDLLKELGLGYRAFSGTIRRGVVEIVNLQGRYHSVVDKAAYCKAGETEMRNFIKEVFGDADAYMINEKDKQRIREFVRQIEAEWEKDDE